MPSCCSCGHSLTAASTLSQTSDRTSPMCTQWPERCTLNHSHPARAVLPCQRPTWRTADTAWNRSGWGTSSVPTGGGIHDRRRRTTPMLRPPGMNHPTLASPGNPSGQGVTMRWWCTGRVTWVHPPGRCGHGTPGQLTYQTPMRRGATARHSPGGTVHPQSLTAIQASSGRLSGPTSPGAPRMTSHWWTSPTAAMWGFLCRTPPWCRRPTGQGCTHLETGTMSASHHSARGSTESSLTLSHWRLLVLLQNTLSLVQHGRDRLSTPLVWTMVNTDSLLYKVPCCLPRPCSSCQPVKLIM